MTELLEINQDLLDKKKDEDDIIINTSRKSTFTGDRAEEKELLQNMGFEADLINTIYRNMNPIDLQEALDFLNKNEKGQFTHSFLINENNVCTICGKGRNEHESDTIFVENDDDKSDKDDNKDEDKDFLDELLGTRLSSSNRFNAYENSYRKSLGSEKKKNSITKLNTNKTSNKECALCFEAIENPAEVKLKCGHYFCKDCWIDYLKEKITNANVSKILCMQHGCGGIIETKFIKDILKDNKDLSDKYDKFYQRKKMLEKSDKVKFCPFPDCEGYAEKKTKNKYVKCNFGHEFCFECGNAPHGKKKCSEMVDKEFEEWRSHKIVKRCPCCRMWTEKNEGCNHMTCVECKFQWCWLCQKPYNYNHFYEGSCNGLQFYKETDENIIKKKLEENRKKYPGPSKVSEYFFNFLKTIGYIFLVVYLKLITDNDNIFNQIDADSIPVFFYMAYLPMFITFEIFFIICTIIGTIPLLFFPKYFRKLKFFIAYRLFQI